MIYNDPIYGKVKIEEPVILELIKSLSLQRLKGISQLGHKAWFPEVSHTRFDHSLGVFVFLKKFGASIEEQIAGLIHDVSHTVFCHSGDYIFDSGCQKNHTFQDNIHKDFVLNTDIPKILKKHGFDVDFILDDKNFPLKEMPLPDLCADRIDYFLRDAFHFKELSRKEIKEILDNFEIVKNHWVLKDFKTANKFAKKYRKVNNLYWSGIKAALMFGTVSETIKYGLRKKYLKKEDIFATDKKVLDKLNKFKDRNKNLELLLKRMNRKIKWKLNKKHYDLHLFTKSRIVDPLIKRNGKIKRLSEIDRGYLKILKKEPRSKEYYIKFLVSKTKPC